MEQKEKVTTRLTRPALRAMQDGETRTFALPGVKECDNAKSLAYQYQHHLACRFTVRTDYDRCEVTITKLPLVPGGKGNGGRTEP